MMGEYPKIEVYEKKNPKKPKLGFSGRIAVIGAFDITDTDPIYCEDLDDAYIKLGTDKTYDGVSALEYLFVGADGIIAVNVTTKSDATPPVIEKDITAENLAISLSKIKNERFDMLFIAGEMSDVMIPLVTQFTSQRLLNKLPIGYMFGIDRTTKAEYQTTMDLIDDASYGVITQHFIINNQTLSLINSCAYYMGLVAKTGLGNSMTKKKIDDVEGLTPELVFETVEDGVSGLDLLKMGITTFECFDRENDEYVCVNSQQPNGLDLYINRVRDYVIRQMALHDFLGERNRPRTLSEVEQELSRIKKLCVDTLDLLTDIEYNVVKKSPNCVDVNITKLLFDGVITHINVYFTIEVE